MKGNFKIGDKIKFINHIKNVGNNFDIVFCYKHSGILNSDKNANFIISKNEGLIIDYDVRYPIFYLVEYYDLNNIRYQMAFDYLELVEKEISIEDIYK